MAPSERGLPRGVRLGESAVEKRYKVVNLARRGLLPSRLRRATSLPDGGMTLSVALTRATSPEVRGIFHFGVSRNFTAE